MHRFPGQPRRIGIYLSTNATVSATFLDFPTGKVGTPDQPESLTLTNNGPTAIDITGITFSSADADQFSQTNDCGQVLRAHSSCLITVTFLPTNGNGAVAFMNIAEGTTGTQVIRVSGAANGAAPAVVLSGYQLNWGPVNVGQSSGAGQVQLTDIGSGNVSSLVVAISGANASDFAITADNSPKVVLAGASCNVSVVFTPTAPGLRTALLTFTDYAYGSPQTVTLSGRDLAREIREYFIPDFSDSREDRAYQGAIERVLKGLRPMSV